MIFVDTSVWIEPLSVRSRNNLAEEALVQFVTCGPILQEVLRGLRPGLQSDTFREAFLALQLLSDPLPLRLFSAAADIYRLGRRRGITIRSSTDCLIAAIAIENRVPVWHRDRDFAAISGFTALEAMQ